MTDRLPLCAPGDWPLPPQGEGLWRGCFSPPATPCPACCTSLWKPPSLPGAAGLFQGLGCCFAAGSLLSGTLLFPGQHLVMRSRSRVTLSRNSSGLPAGSPVPGQRSTQLFLKGTCGPGGSQLSVHAGGCCTRLWGHRVSLRAELLLFPSVAAEEPGSVSCLLFAFQLLPSLSTLGSGSCVLVCRLHRDCHLILLLAIYRAAFCPLAPRSHSSELSSPGQERSSAGAPHRARGTGRRLSAGWAQCCLQLGCPGARCRGYRTPVLAAGLLLLLPCLSLDAAGVPNPLPRASNYPCL